MVVVQSIMLLRCTLPYHDRGQFPRRWFALIIIAVIVIVASGTGSSNHANRIAITAGTRDGGAGNVIYVATAATTAIVVDDVVIVAVFARTIDTGTWVGFFRAAHDGGAGLRPVRLADAVVDVVANARMVRTVRSRVRGRIGR